MGVRFFPGWRESLCQSPGHRVLWMQSVLRFIDQSKLVVLNLTTIASLFSMHAASSLNVSGRSRRAIYNHWHCGLSSAWGECSRTLRKTDSLVKRPYRNNITPAPR